MASDVDTHPEDDETWLGGFPLDGSEEESRVSASAILVSSSRGVTRFSWGQIPNVESPGFYLPAPAPAVSRFALAYARAPGRKTAVAGQRARRRRVGGRARNVAVPVRERA